MINGRLRGSSLILQSNSNIYPQMLHRSSAPASFSIGAKSAGYEGETLDRHRRVSSVVKLPEANKNGACLNVLIESRLMRRCQSAKTGRQLKGAFKSTRN